MIEVKDLHKSYGKREVLKGITFTIDDGQIVGLLGSNGAGKSTTMNIVTGYLKADSGEVKIGGADILKEPVKAKENIGYLPEIPPLYKDMKVFEYLYFVCELKGIKDKAKKSEEADRVMGLLSLTDRRDDFIKRLSKGYQQRVGFAGALVGDPKVLILDEPLVGLDPAEAKNTRELIKSLKKDHVIIISSHILSEIEELCNEILMIKDGEIVVDDSTKDVKNREKYNTYSLVIKGSKDDILGILENYTGLTDVVYYKETEDGVHEFRAKTKNKRDIRDSLFGYLVSKKLSVYGITKVEASLEDVYIEMNKGGNE